METLLDTIITGSAAALTISLWTFRVALAGRGRHLFSAVIAGVEAVLFVVVFTGLVTNLGNPIRLTGYALGVAAGTLIGLTADDRLSSGQSEVRLVVIGDGAQVIDLLHRAGWPATWTSSMGPDGPATSVFVAVDDRRRNDLLGLIDGLEPAPFVTVERLSETRPGPLPSGYIQLGERRARRRPVTRV
jgi:uncharacterized protein YebE (UPF0316 family)